MYLVKTIIQGSLLTTSNAIYYTAPTGVSMQLVNMVLVNTDSVARTVSVYLVDDGAAPTAADTILKNKTLQPNESYPVSAALAAVVSAAGTIQAIADAGSVVVLKASGIEFTS